MRTTTQQAEAALKTSQEAIEAASAELVSTQAALQQTVRARHLAISEVLRSPVSERVPILHLQSEGVVSPRELLVEFGGVDNLDVRAEVLPPDRPRG